MGTLCQDRLTNWPLVVIQLWLTQNTTVGGDEIGSLKSETVKYGHESQGTQTRERLHWRGPAAYTKDRPSSRPSERAPQKNKTVTVKE
jgi:hypothetical protein